MQIFGWPLFLNFGTLQTFHIIIFNKLWHTRNVKRVIQGDPKAPQSKRVARTRIIATKWLAGKRVQKVVQKVIRGVIIVSVLIVSANIVACIL